MFESLYPLVGVLTIGVALFISGIGLGSAFLESRMAAAAKAHPFTTRWFFVILIALFIFLFFRFVQPLYYTVVVGCSCAAVAWGFLSRIEKRFLWKELLTLSFWFPISTVRTLAKDGM
jgi:hypothetical protein